MSIIKSFTIDQVPVAGYTVMELTLDQKLLKPNEIRFTLRRNSLDRNDESVKFTNAKDILSKEVECSIRTTLKGKDENPSNSNGVNDFIFSGSIVSATFGGQEINCVALSKDYELSLIPHCRYFINQKLQDIVNAVYAGPHYANPVKHVDPHYTDPIPYVVQYNETDYDFLVRLAKRFGEFFYFDQSLGLVFGKPGSELVTLKKFVDYYGAKFELNSGNPNHAYVANHYQAQGVIRSAFKDYTAANYLFEHSKAASTSLAAVDANTLYYDYPDLLPGEVPANPLEAPGDLWNKSEESGFVVCHFTSYRPDLPVGRLVCLCENYNSTLVIHGVFIITSTHLTLDCNGSPLNEITAIGNPLTDPNNPVDAHHENMVAPYLDVNAYPRSAAQRAIVVDNRDPLKLGRVMVRFAWMDVAKDKLVAIKDNDDEATRKKYPWIRIAQPYGGRNKGCYILPEIGEEVMVGFEHDNLEKPFVIGTLFNNTPQGNEQAPDNQWCEVKDQDPNKNNEVKAFRTKKGHTIEFHDTDQGVGFIRIYNHDMADPAQAKPNYDIILSTDDIQKKEGDEKKNYTVKGLSEEADDVKAQNDLKEKEDVEAGKLRIMVRSYDGDIMLDAGNGDIILNAKNIRVHTKGNRTSLIEGNDILKVTRGSFTQEGTRSLVVKGKQDIKVEGESSATYQKKITVTANDAFEQKLKSQTSTIDEKMTVNANEVAVESKQSASVKVGSSELELTNTDALLKGIKATVDATTKATVKNGVTSLDIEKGTASRNGHWEDK